MKTPLYISSYVSVKNGKLFKEGECIKTISVSNFQDFSKAAYQYLDMKYLKFYKMDNLCKLAMIASELLLQEIDLSDYDKSKIALVLANKSSSLDTDVVHQKSISDSANYFPSPSVFVYTLPNIMLGEICIKNKFQGENLCLVSEQFDEKLVDNYINILFSKGNTDAVIVGWIEYFEEKYEAFLVFVDKNNVKNITFGSDTLLKLYKA
jgi:hypothetical protein